MLELDEVLADEHVRARGMVAGALLATPVRLSATPADSRAAARPGSVSTPTRCSPSRLRARIAALREAGAAK